jgi:hypothetical protein
MNEHKSRAKEVLHELRIAHVEMLGTARQTATHIAHRVMEAIRQPRLGFDEKLTNDLMPSKVEILPPPRNSLITTASAFVSLHDVRKHSFLLERMDYIPDGTFQMPLCAARRTLDPNMDERDKADWAFNYRSHHRRQECKDCWESEHYTEASAKPSQSNRRTSPNRRYNSNRDIEQPAQYDIRIKQEADKYQVKRDDVIKVTLPMTPKDDFRSRSPSRTSRAKSTSSRKRSCPGSTEREVSPEETAIEESLKNVQLKLIKERQERTKLEVDIRKANKKKEAEYKASIESSHEDLAELQTRLNQVKREFELHRVRCKDRSDEKDLSLLGRQESIDALKRKEKLYQKDIESDQEEQEYRKDKLELRVENA